MHTLRIALTIIMLAAFSAAIFGQGRLTEVAFDRDLSVTYEFLGKPGPIVKSTVNLPEVPGAARIPTAYKPLQNNSYRVKIDAIYYGDPIFSFKVPINSEPEFKKVRILQLAKNDINPSGYEWIDCTVSPEYWLNPPDHVKAAEKKKMSAFLPNYPNRRVSCITEFRADNYFATVQQLRQAPAQPFTTISVILEKVIEDAQTGQTVYTISVKNTGATNIGEVNLASRFDYDTRMLSMKPSQGTCKRNGITRNGNADICHLGALGAGKTATIEFAGQSSGMQSGEVRKLNQNWSMSGYIKELEGDPNWPLNFFSFEPLQ